MYKENQDFVTELRHDLNHLARTLKNTVGRHCIRVVRELITIANENARIKNIEIVPGFVFGVSRKILCSRLGLNDSLLKKILHLIAGLGLIKRLRVDEAGHIDEYYGELGIAAQQYRLDVLDRTEIRRRWNIFISSNIDIYHSKLNIDMVEKLFSIEKEDTIATRPEAFEINDILRAEGRRIRRERLNCNRNIEYKVEKTEVTYSASWGIMETDIIRTMRGQKQIFQKRKE